MNRFEKISKKQCQTDGVVWEDIQLPARATKGSAGYDFYALEDIELDAGETIKVPTGIRVQLDEGKFLLIVPRSGLGFKFRLQLDNTVGVIDSDYYGSDNEGHIWIKMTNDSREEKGLKIPKGVALVQGIILNYCKTESDTALQTRNGGFGSTD